MLGLRRLRLGRHAACREPPGRAGYYSDPAIHGENLIFTSEGDLWSVDIHGGGGATAGETGVYGPEGRWLIEGHGVDPDIVVDDLPHATFAGEDAQLQTAIRLLRSQIQTDPRPVPPAPAYPNKAAPALP